MVCSKYSYELETVRTGSIFNTPTSERPGYQFEMSGVWKLSDDGGYTKSIYLSISNGYNSIQNLQYLHNTWNTISLYHTELWKATLGPAVKEEETSLGNCVPP